MSKRIKAFKVTPQFVVALVTSKEFSRCSNDSFPEGCEFHSCYYEHHCLSFFIIVEHPSFELVPEGGEIPKAQVILEIENK